MNKDRLITLTMIILAAAVSRILPHPDNVAPIAAMALFGAAQFERKWLAFAVPLLALLISDAFIGFYEHMYVTYVGFIAVTCIGLLLRGHVKPLPVVGATLGASVAFFLITNCALWIHYDLYPKTLEGVTTGYIAALPLFRNTVIGDLFYSALLFGGFALAERRYLWLRAPQLATA
jgi:hypothetical protein